MAYAAVDQCPYSRGWLEVRAGNDSRIVIVAPEPAARMLPFGWDDAGSTARTFLTDLGNYVAGAAPNEPVDYGYTLKDHPDGSKWWEHVILTVSTWAGAGVVGNLAFKYLIARLPGQADNRYEADFNTLTHLEAEAFARWIVCAEFHEEDCNCLEQRLTRSHYPITVFTFRNLTTMSVERNDNQWTVELAEGNWRYTVTGINGQLFYGTVRRSLSD